MKITINTDILKKHDLSLGDFLLMLLAYYDIDFNAHSNNLISKNLISKSLFKDNELILSNNTKNKVAEILMESDDKAINYPIDFDNLATKLMECYPNGIKAGKTYLWRGTVNEIAYKLRTLVVKHNFNFTEQQAIEATKEYVASFEPPYQHMHTLKNFISYVSNKNGQLEFESLFMTIIENKLCSSSYTHSS